MDQGQGDRSEMQAMKAFHAPRPLRNKLRAQRLKFRPSRKGLLKLCFVKGVFLNGDKMQTLMGFRSLRPGLPGREEV